MAQAPYYHATLCLHGSLIVTKSEQPGGVKVAVGLGDTQVPVGVKRRLVALLQEKPPEGEQGIIVWPRTDKEGLLGNGTQLALYKGIGELNREPGLHALGELVKVDKENALLQLQIHPNEGQGSLQKPFRLPLVAIPRAARGIARAGQWPGGVGRAEATYGAAGSYEGASCPATAQAGGGSASGKVSNQE